MRATYLIYTLELHMYAIPGNLGRRLRAASGYGTSIHNEPGCVATGRDWGGLLGGVPAPWRSW
jgi:hypothetical protein